MNTKKTTASLDRKPLATIKNFTQAELRDELVIAQKALFTLTMKKNLGELKQTHLMKSQRKYIAQISTFLASAL